MIAKQNLVLLMVMAALAVAVLIYFFTDSIKWAVGVAGICFAIDLSFAPWIRKKMDEINKKR